MSPGASSSYAIRLTWSAPVGSDPAVSYNVYRELSAGAVGFAQINTSPVVAVTYTDNAVQPGESYTYVVRAMDAEGEESDPSNSATFTIPSN
ncbi:MAG: fibronectin type III domain-containing protein [Acidobacteriaceae bacterium]